MSELRRRFLKAFADEERVGHGGAYSEFKIRVTWRLALVGAALFLAGLAAGLLL